MRSAATTRNRQHESHIEATVIDVARQIVFMAIAALLYFGVRAVTKSRTSVAIDHGNDLLAFERRLHLDVEVWLQHQILDSHVLVTAANWVYMFGHWPVIITAFVWLYSRHRDEYRLLRNAMFISGAIGLVIFWRYPVAPPRLTTDLLVDTVAKYSHTYRRLQPPSIEDRYASLPSLHLGWNLLVGLAVARSARHRIVRLLGAISPMVMAAAVVVTANHYIVDVLLGAAVALLGFLVSMHITPLISEAVSGRRLHSLETTSERSPEGVAGETTEWRRTSTSG